jgi:hypothetical protein
MLVLAKLDLGAGWQMVLCRGNRNYTVLMSSKTGVAIRILWYGSRIADARAILTYLSGIPVHVLLQIRTDFTKEGVGLYNAKF